MVCLGFEYEPCRTGSKSSKVSLDEPWNSYGLRLALSHLDWSCKWTRKRCKVETSEWKALEALLEERHAEILSRFEVLLNHQQYLGVITEHYLQLSSQLT